MFSFRDFLLTLSIPIQKIIQKLHPPYAQTTVFDADQVMKVMQDGDILLSRELWHFSNLLIPNFWSHAAIYGKGNIVEAVAPRVQVVDFRDWVIEKHFWVVLRPYFNVKDGYQVYRDALSLKGTAYDYLFKKGNKLTYCSELARDVQYPNLPDFLKQRENGLLPQHFYNAALQGKLRVIHEHRDK